MKLTESTGAGVRSGLCPEQGLSVVFRAGGERCKPVGRAHSRPLKKWLQELHVVPWMRAYLPILADAEGQPLAVGGLFECATQRAAPGEAGLQLVWEDGPAILAEQEKIS